MKLLERFIFCALLIGLLLAAPATGPAQTLTWQGAQPIEDNAGFDGRSPQVALSGSSAVAVWAQSDGSKWRIYSNYSTDGGATWQGAQLIEDNAGFDGYGAQVALSGSTAVAVWSQWDGSNDRIYSNYSTDGGATWQGAQPIEGNAGFNGYNTQVALSGSIAVAVWEQWDGSNYHIHSNYSTDGGATWHSAQPIEDNAGFSAYGPQVALSGSTAVAVWRQKDGSNDRIYWNYSTDGGATWHSAQLIDNAGFDGDDPQVALSGSIAVAVWWQDDGSNERIYSNYGTFASDYLWAGATDLGGGWKWLSWFGYFFDAGDGWIYHNEQQWMYAYGTTTSDIWFWTADMGWLWTSDATYPYLYRHNDGAWLYYQVGSFGPRWFYNFTAGSWESH